MKNVSLVEDYLVRAGEKLLPVKLFASKESWVNAMR
jgi:hypothetical protein